MALITGIGILIFIYKEFWKEVMSDLSRKCYI